MINSLLRDKTIVIMGVRNRWSIAWGIAQAAAEAGANLIFTVQSEREMEQVSELIKTLGDFPLFRCDVGSDAEITALFTELKSRFGVIHGLVHAIAHAKAEDIQHGFVETSRDGFAHALNVSVYSLIALCRAARELMSEGGGVVTLSYIGAERVIPGYNVMGVAKAALEASVRYLAGDLGPQGIRVNAISAGPIKTISAKGIKNFGNLLEEVAVKTPLGRGINQEDVGGAALYLLSDLSRGITGEVLHVDCGYHMMGV